MTTRTKLKALILTGGKSSRMGKDKGAIEYHGKSQVSFLYDLLKDQVDETYISCRSEQKGERHLEGFPLIEDSVEVFGPSAGILSAFKKDPQASWLVLAVDMPFVNGSTITELIKKRNHKKMATCFHNGEKKWPEPLCAIYEPSIVKNIQHYVELGKPCPRKVLMNSDIELLVPLEERVLQNANTPQDFQKISEVMEGAKL